MTARARFAVLVLATSLPLAAAAQGLPPAPPSGWTMAVRTGFGLPMGDLATANTGATYRLSNEFSGQIPFWFDVGYRFEQRFFVGGYLQVGYPFIQTNGGGLVDTECHVTGVASCSGNASVRGGLEFLVDIMPDQTVRPWAGVGVGYEMTGYQLKDSQGGTANVSYNGWEFLNLQLGADFNVNPRFRVGPFASLSLAQYDKIEVSSGADTQSITIASKKMHEWLQFGVRGTVDF